ncbi:MAG: hypothetical protein WBD31_16655, partial [Rubripirellula sp.]
MLRCQPMIIALAITVAIFDGFAIGQEGLRSDDALHLWGDAEFEDAISPTQVSAPVGIQVLEAESIVAPTPSLGDEHGEVIVIDASELAPEETDTVFFGDWLGYNPTQHDDTWVTGNGDRLGIFSSESFPALAVGKNSNLMIGTGIHFVNGPIATDLPPRLFDLQLAHQSRKTYGERLILDTKIGVGAFTDFEGSVRKGIRFPGHAVGYYQWHPWLVSVLGIEFLDRDDVS